MDKNNEAQILQRFAKKLLGSNNSILEMFNLVPSMLLRNNGKLLNFLINWQLIKLFLPLLLLVGFMFFCCFMGTGDIFIPPKSQPQPNNAMINFLFSVTGEYCLLIIPILWASFCYYGGKKLFRILFL